MLLPRDSVAFTIKACFNPRRKNSHCLSAGSLMSVCFLESQVEWGTEGAVARPLPTRTARPSMVFTSSAARLPLILSSSYSNQQPRRANVFSRCVPSVSNPRHSHVKHAAGPTLTAWRRPDRDWRLSCLVVRGSTVSKNGVQVRGQPHDPIVAQ